MIYVFSIFLCLYIFSQVKIGLDLGSVLESQVRDLVGVAHERQASHRAGGPSTVFLTPNPFFLVYLTFERLSIHAVLEN